MGCLETWEYPPIMLASMEFAKDDKSIMTMIGRFAKQYTTLDPKG